MRFNKRSASLVAAAMGALILAPIQPPSAFATTAQAKNSTISISSGKLIIFASGVQTFTNPAAIYTSAVVNGTPKNFFINNSGSFTSSRFAMTISLPANSNVSAFRRCNINVAFTGTNVCASGSSTTQSITPGSAVTYVLSTTPNSFYCFQLVQNMTGVITVSTSASTSFITTSVTNS